MSASSACFPYNFSGIQFQETEEYVISEEENQDPIDFEPLHEPVVTKCNHLFSKENLVRALNANPYNQTCPLDRTALTPLDIWKIKKLTIKLKDEEVSLPMDRSLPASITSKSIDKKERKKLAEERKFEEIAYARCKKIEDKMVKKMKQLNRKYNRDKLKIQRKIYKMEKEQKKHKEKMERLH